MFLFAEIMGITSAVQFEVTIVMSSSMIFIVTLINWVGFEENAETKWLHLCAIMFSAPPFQNPGNLVLRIALVHGSHPWLMYFGALATCESLWAVGSVPRCGAGDGCVSFFDVEPA
jgi:hypothetical protein